MNNKLSFFLRKSITYKIFLITLILLIISATVIYSALYFFLPSFYEKNKESKLDTGVEKLIKDTENLSFNESKDYIDNLAFETNSQIILNDNRGEIVYVSSIHSSIQTEVKIYSGAIFLPNKVGEKNGLSSNVLSSIKAGSVNTSIQGYNKLIPITFTDRSLILHINATFQPINEASHVLILFVPYIGIIILLISVVGAFFYSRIISKPLISINKSAKKMANLEFVTIDSFSSKDEIGELSNSLNELSSNLQKTMIDLHEANEKLKNEIIREREIEDKRRELFAMISHELKSPLTAVKGQLEGMIYGFGAYKDRDKYLKRSYEIMENMEKLIYEILQIAKLEQHTFSPKKEDINLTNLVNNVIKKVEFFAEEKNIKIISQISENAIISTDKDLIEKAVYNIIHNGVIYSNEGERVIINLNDNNDTGTVDLMVLNTGVNIPEENKQKIFSPFFRLDKYGERNKGGSGLGLFLVKKVFESLSIDYSIENTAEGVLFTVNFEK
ncbi:HAMP domain-containing sensor histidine kinase [Clostridium sp. AL.422]|uniref:sensor histidine kinase n=1 Tax=Clostridium TaxID=1485 RepID=UPI00293DC8E3|nr:MULTISPECIES: HAMP domain-containing sensor histidine kinase [unclassified Clostridium]MDV4151320.1 HAMP domain-containing sensor histidine kinase [Clostridium sp. AL.422]